jgi:hypothetical protein
MNRITVLANLAGSATADMGACLQGLCRELAVTFTALEASVELTIEDSGRVRPDATQDATARDRANAVTIARLLVRQLGGRLETPQVVGGNSCIVTVPRPTNRRWR